MNEKQPRSDARQAFGDIAPKLAELSDDMLFGDIWERPQLSKRDRSLITCTALVALGKTDQMMTHFPRATPQRRDPGGADRDDHAHGLLLGLAERRHRRRARQGSLRQGAGMSAMNVGYVGLGSMGAALARRLQLQFPLLVYDLNPDAVQRMVDKGSTASPSLGDLASRCNVIVLCLPTSDHVRAAICGDNGLSTGLKPGTLIVDQTTGDPIATRAMADDLAKRGVQLIDAPVSGGAQGADAGTIAIMVGAAPEQYARAHALLAKISSNVFHAGGVGAGQVIKLVNNMLSAAQRLLTFEGVALAAKNGVDPQRACEILLAGGARNSFLEKFMGPQILKGNLSPGFTLGLMHKDVRLACELGSDSGVPMFFGNLTRELYQMCISEMGAAAQVHTAALVMDRLAGTHVVPTTNPQ